MSRSHPGRATAIFAALALATAARAQDPTPLPLPPSGGKPLFQPEYKPDAPDSRVVVLERGPIHEAFAQPGAAIRGKGITAPKAPPAPVAELQPEVKPEGAG